MLIAIDSCFLKTRKIMIAEWRLIGSMFCYDANGLFLFIMHVPIAHANIHITEDRNGNHWSGNSEGLFFVQQLFYLFLLGKIQNNRCVPRKYGKFFRLTVKMPKNIVKSLALLKSPYVCVACRVQSNVFRRDFIVSWFRSSLSTVVAFYVTYRISVHVHNIWSREF